MKEDAITGRQLFVLIFMTQLGLEVMSLPHVEADIAGHDMWLSVFLSGLCAQAGIMLIWWLGSRYPSRNCFAYVPQIVGRPVGAFVNLMYGCYYAISGLMLILNYTDVLNRWLFVYTPGWIITLMIFIACGYAASLSLRRIAYIAQSYLILSVIAILLIAGCWLYGPDVKNLLPVLSGGWNPVVKGIYYAFSGYVGYDLLLYAFPYVKAKSKNRLLLIMTFANMTAILYYVLSCLICSTMFSLKQLKHIPEPIVFILKYYQLEVLQSLDVMFLIFYVFIVSDTAYIYFFLSAKAFVHLRSKGLGKHQIWVWAMVGLAFIGSLFFKKRSTIINFSDLQDIGSVFMIIAVPAVLLIISGLRGAGRNRA
ncbi:GerAB/ArcD/ProY family transporter [Paenibacillus taihuensis]|nr:GerAB/ArcD/ProY family transporter [Paenibacillus taihuensis]